MATAIEFAILAKDKASKVFEQVGKESDKSATKMAKFHKVGAAAGIALAGGLVLAGKAAEEMTKKAAENQQSASLMAQTFHRAAGATKEQIASTEEWIDAQGKALGVSRDDLRPALSKLVVATGSVAKAQKLASLAMNVSAGTGKSLTSVSFALAKAQNGNVTGLSRLGIQTTKTTGDTMALQKAQTAVKSAQLSLSAAVKAYGPHSAQASIASDKLKQAQENVGAAQAKTKKTTLSLDQITKNLAKTYGGAAAKNAQTAAGKQKILAVQMNELQVKIGTALLPVMTKLVSVGMRVVNWIDQNTKVAGLLVAGLGGLLAVTWAISAATKMFTVWQTAWNAVMTLGSKAALGTRIQLAALWVQEKIGAAVTKSVAAAQWLLNAAMDANPIGLVVLAVAALAVGMVIAYKKSATFRAIVQAAFHGIESAARSVADFFTHKIPAAFDKVKAGASNALGWVKGHWPQILAILAGPIGIAVLVIARNWGKIKDAASNAVSGIKNTLSGLVGFVTGMPSRIGHAAAGMFDGIKQAFRASVDWIIGKWNGLSFSIPGVNTHIPGVGKIGGFTLSTPNIPYLAKGGIVTRPTIAMLGESGPERVQPLTGPNAKLGMGGGDIYLTVHVSGLVDPQTMTRAIWAEVLKLQRRGAIPAL